MILLVIIGAIVGATVFRELEFSILGGFLGFLLARINQLTQRLGLFEEFVRSLGLRDRLKSFEKNQTVSIEEKSIPQTSDVVPAKKEKLQANKLPSIPAENQAITNKESISNPEAEEVKIRVDTSQQHINATNNQQDSVPPFKQKSETGNVGRTPDIFDKIIKTVTDYFTQGNIVVRVGAVILFFGVAFLLKYAAENTNISMSVRLIGVAIGAIAMLAFGWKLKDKRQGYGLILQGTAVGILYLTLFAAFRLYDLVPAGLAFPLLILFSAFAMALAVLQDSRSLAILSIAGGFLAPVLTSTGSGSHIALFSYYTILNLGIFGVAWFKSWRLLNLVGFVFTFLIGTAWGVTKYQAADFATTEPFLILFFLLYSAISLLFSIKQKPSLKGYLDATLVFGLPLISFSLQAAMVQQYEYGLAWSAFALGGFYLASASIVLKGKNENLKVIAEAYLALGIIFVSLVIPFALDGQWTAASWAIEGAGLVWVGIRQSRWFAKYFGTLIQFAGGLIFLTEIGRIDSPDILFDSETLGIIFVSIAALFSSFQIFNAKPQLKSFERNTHFVYLIWGLMWWYFGGLEKLDDYFGAFQFVNSAVLFVAISGLIFYFLERKYHWTILSRVTWITLTFSIIIGAGYLNNHAHLFDKWSSLLWLFAIGSFYWCHYERDKHALTETTQNETGKSVLSKYNISSFENGLLHSLALISLMGLVFVEILWLIEHFKLSNTSWGIAILGLLIGLWLFLISKVNRWPIVTHPVSYFKVGISVLLVAAVYWSLLLNFPHPGNAQPLAFMPFINPLDIAQGLLLIMMYLAAKKQITAGVSYPENSFLVVFAVFGFVWLNVILFRSIHTWGGVTYRLDTLFDSFLVQTSLSIFWTLIGLTGTVISSRFGSRKFWIYGAILIGVVVLKLFVIDLDNSSSIERIISFVVVGLLLLIVGYFSPIPTKVAGAVEND